MRTAIPDNMELQTGEIYSDEIDGYLQYKLICTNDPYRRNDSLCNKVYSLLIVKLKEVDIPETFFMYDITRNKNKAFDILSCLQSNRVTPCIAEGVLQDIII